ncbi:cell division protein FtsL [Listeria sp. PSOL-1]|uniref:cell division protein FtsL n=1 Tax=Listeria sp. PSOL-1 TaxID=1844999 RepID=UPI0013D43A3E|nr:cell division protein FtsL [Listeria sp. PSOL-1]
MSNVAYKSHLEREQIHTEKPKKQILKRGQVTLGEKIIIVVAALVIAFLAFQIIGMQASMYNVNKDIQASEAKVTDQQKQNSELNTQVKDLSKYERILKKAKEKGLKLNENNVKVVGGK